MTAHINQFFVDVLGAKVVNERWSWGAYDPIANRIYLRLWADLISKGGHGERVEVLWITKKRNAKHGFNERVRHIELMKAGVDGYGVVCTAKDPDSLWDREIVSFDKDSLIRLGIPSKVGGRIYCPILGRIQTNTLARQASSFGDLPKDIRNLIADKSIPRTTREVLVSARVGQGPFRTRVLLSWENRCAVSTRPTSIP